MLQQMLKNRFGSCLRTRSVLDGRQRRTTKSIRMMPFVPVRLRLYSTVLLLLSTMMQLSEASCPFNTTLYRPAGVCLIVVESDVIKHYQRYVAKQRHPEEYALNKDMAEDICYSLKKLALPASHPNDDFKRNIDALRTIGQKDNRVMLLDVLNLEMLWFITEHVPLKLDRVALFTYFEREESELDNRSEPFGRVHRQQYTEMYNPGDCGLLLQDKQNLMRRGIWWVDCQKPFKKIDSNVIKTNTVVCQLQEPRDCRWKAMTNSCMLTDDDRCILPRIVVNKGNDALGKPCNMQINRTAKPCPAKKIGECAQPCQWTEWKAPYGCISCHSAMYTRYVRQPAKFGGAPCLGGDMEERNCECSASPWRVIRSNRLGLTFATSFLVWILINGQ